MGLLIQWCSQCLLFIRGTILPETSIAPENWPSRKEIHLSTINFQGLDALVSGMVFHRFLGPPSPTREAKDPETQGCDKLVLLLQAYARPPPRESLPSSLTGRGCGVWVFFCWRDEEIWGASCLFWLRLETTCGSHNEGLQYIPFKDCQVGGYDLG